MKIKQNNKKATIKIGSLILGLGLITSGITFTINQAMATMHPKSDYVKEGVKTYIDDPFSAEYSKGILYYKGAGEITGHGAQECERTFENGTKQYFWCGSNSSISDTIYIEIKNGAVYNNELLDVREYLAITGTPDNPNAQYRWGFDKTTPWVGIASGNDDYDSKVTHGTFYVTRRIRFYNKQGQELEEFKGIISYSDFEPANKDGEGGDYEGIGEGYTIANGLRQTYLYYDERGETILSHNGPFKNSWSNFDNPLGEAWDTKYILWTEVEGSKTSPIELVYQAPLIGRLSRNNTASSKVSYVVNGKIIDKEDIVVQYGTLDPTPPEDIPEGMVFDGWYKDEAMTPSNKITEPFQVTGDTTLYGKYVETEKAKVTTSIENGTIDESKDDIEPGIDYVVKYQCDEDYTLSSRRRRC